MNVLALFAGIGGIELGLEATGGFRTVCCVEKDRYAVEVLKARMQEGTLADAPIWDDVTTFDGRPWRGLVDVVTGGFPCQDISVAGKGAGIAEGTRSGLWSEMFRIVREVRPRYVLIENVSALLTRGLGRVLADLSSCGYDADWDCVPARSVGAPHRRDRIFIVAHRAEHGRTMAEPLCRRGPQNDVCAGRDATGCGGAMPDPRTWWLVDPADALGDPCGERREGQPRRATGQEPTDRHLRVEAADVDDAEGQSERAGLCENEPQGERGRRPGDADGRATQPCVGRVAHGIPARVHRLRCLGNAVVPQVAYYIGLRILAHVKETP